MGESWMYILLLKPSNWVRSPGRVFNQLQEGALRNNNVYKESQLILVPEGSLLFLFVLLSFFFFRTACRDLAS